MINEVWIPKQSFWQQSKEKSV